MWDRSKLFSIKPKHEKRLFVYFCVFLRICLSCTKNCSEHQNKTIFGATQVNSGENTKVNKQSLVKFWPNWRKYGVVSYSFSYTHWHIFYSKTGHFVKHLIYGVCYNMKYTVCTKSARFFAVIYQTEMGCSS